MNVSSTRRTDCFLSNGTGIVAIHNLLWLKDRAPCPLALAGVATNLEITHILFRTLLTAFAPTNGQQKYWRFNIEGTIEEKYDYKGVGELDDVKAVKELVKRAARLIPSNEDDLPLETSLVIPDSYDEPDESDNMWGPLW